MSRSFITSLDPKNKAHLKGVSQLHSELLPDSLTAKLGHLFMERFYYYILIKHGLLECDLFIHNGEVAGFCSYTYKPYSFMADGQRKSPLYLLAVLLISVIVKPSRILDISEAIRLSKVRRLRANNANDGEFISLAILPLNVSIRDEISGRYISDEFYERVVVFMRDRKMTSLRAMVLKSNKLAIRFHERHGAILKEGDVAVPIESCLFEKKIMN